MTRLFRRWAYGALALVAGLALATPAHAQYFGRNKVQYEQFGFRIMKSDHFDYFFYPAESLATADAARMGERWYARLSDIFRHQFDRKSVIFYADHPDFEQTNVVGEAPEEGTGGITEGLRTRVIMPFTGSYWDNNHVLGHELVHVFQYNVAEAGPGGLARLNALPLWLIEGMAEYLSLGRNDPLTAMWLRDADIQNKLPTVKQLTTDPRFFPYRYGQALWAYVGGRWGDRAVIDVYRTALRVGWDESLKRVLGVSSDSLSKDWIASIHAAYDPLLVGRARGAELGKPIVGELKKRNEYNIAPTISPDGKYVAFFSTRELFSSDIFVADAHTGKIIKKLAGPRTDAHFDAISWVQSSGTWSPDSKKFAFVATVAGNQEVAILDVPSDREEKRIKLPGVGAINQLAWSPNGRDIAVSGLSGGISDLYLLDVTAGTVRQLTKDRYADFEPAWSPDGKTIAFASDRGAQTSFTNLTFSPLQLATLDVESGRISVFAPFPSAKAINPQYSPDGQSIFFISDQDGFSDIYRLSLATGAVARVTKVATGVSGITSMGPAISVARNTGRLVYSVFQNQSWQVYGMDSATTAGTPMPAAPPVVAGGILPPGDPPGRAIVTAYLNDPFTGLPPADTRFAVVPYRPSFSLDAIGQPSVGVGASSTYGTQVVGGISFLFGDQLSDRQIFAAIQAQGQLQDIGGALTYLNLKHRINWGASVSHIPYLYGYAYMDQDPSTGQITYNQLLQRVFVDQGSLIAQYPFSTTRRIEFNTGITRYGFGAQIDRYYFDAAGNIYDHRLIDTSLALKPVYFAQIGAALVGDNSFSAFVSPVSGERYRVEYTPAVGSLTFQSLLADYRRYFFMRPFTLAFRGLHYGMYGKDSENYQELMSPIYLGEETLVRGYGYGSITDDAPVECGQALSRNGGCPVFDRLLGSRIAVFNAEFRIPLLGTSEFGLINFPYLPLEVAPFFDAGVAWTSQQPPSLRWTSTLDAGTPAANCTPSLYLNCVERTPVFSTGVSFRFNVLGYFPFEAYLAHPFQRPTKNWVWGFQIAPGF